MKQTDKELLKEVGLEKEEVKIYSLNYFRKYNVLKAFNNLKNKHSAEVKELKKDRDYWRKHYYIVDKNYVNSMIEHEKQLHSKSKKIFDDIEGITVKTDDGYDTDKYERLKKKHLEE